MEKDKIMSPDRVAISAEKQLKDLENANNKKMTEVLKEREYVLALKRTILALVYATGSSYRSVFPGGEGFVEGRIKSQDSIITKTRNEFTEILNEIEENPDIDQRDILDKISKINFKDILAFSVVTTVPPKKFRTGSDEINGKLTELREELDTSKIRMDEHESSIQRKKKKVTELTNDMNNSKNKLNEIKVELKDEVVPNKKQQESKIQSQEERLLKILDDYKAGIISKQDYMQEIDMLMSLTTTSSRLLQRESEIMQQVRILEERIRTLENEIIEAKGDVEYSQGNLERTKNVYTSTLRELQYIMSDYYVSNLEKFSNFKFLGTVPIRTPKKIIKPNFRATNTGFLVTFSDLENPEDKCKVKFEAQGKGGLDYYDAEFTAAGAEYHEEQKTKDGMISKKTEMPDFTIIGKNATEKIERTVRRKYEDISSIEDLLENFEDPKINALYVELKKYEEKIKTEIEAKEGANIVSKKTIKKKMNSAFTNGIENLIQKEIEDEINKCIKIMANSESLDKKIKSSEKLSTFFEDEKIRLKRDSVGSDESEIEEEAKVNLLYYRKEEEIRQYAKTAIPTFFRANLPSDSKQEIVVYLYTTGESIYRYFANKLNGLKDENGKFKYEPQEQQKRALLQLTGLFEENEENFYTYNREDNSFGNIQGEKESKLEENKR